VGRDADDKLVEELLPLWCARRHTPEPDFSESKITVAHFSEQT